MAKAQQYVDQARDFFRDYTRGVNAREMRRLFDRDATEAYKVLTREREDEEPGDDFHRFFYRVKVVFMGLSYKLTPPRRLLFAASLLLALLGLVNPTSYSLRGSDGFGVSVDFSPLFFIASIACLVYLLAMELVDRIRVRDELEVARQLQSDLMPQHAPEMAGYSFAHSYRTANDIGGDYYDFLRLEDGRLALLVGDASGHGIAAGLLMAIANATLKTALDLDPEPARVLKVLNRALYRTGDRRAFMSLFYGLLDPESGRLEFVCAGHPYPLLRRADGEIEELGSGSLPLGVREEMEFDRRDVEFRRGDTLVLYSDGIPEAINAGGEAFGFQRLRRLLEAEGGPTAIHDRVLLSFDSHVGDEALSDDLTLVVVAREAG